METAAPLLSQMDDATAALMIQLLQEDCAAVTTAIKCKGKQAEGTETDAQLALRLFIEEELGPAQMFAFDRRMTRSLQMATQLDGDACVHAQEQERVARSDRNMSLSLTHDRRNHQQQKQRESNQGPKSNITPRGGDDDTDRVLIEKLSAIYITGFEREEADNEKEEMPGLLDGKEGESSAWGASRRTQQQLGTLTKRKPQKRSCAACQDEKHFADLATTPCGHEYCRDCLARLFHDAMTDESLFPPRCCRQPIPPDRGDAQRFLSLDVAQLYHAKALEFSTPNRTYCYSPNCGLFIPPSRYIDSHAWCLSCGCRTCTTCKGANHVGRDCPGDVELQRVIELARQQGWQRCSNCRGMVELNMGCNHMTCRCGHQFCYVCGAQWKTCTCEQWDERRLYARAAQIAARDPDPAPPPPRPAPPPALAAAQVQAQAQVARQAVENINNINNHDVPQPQAPHHVVFHVDTDSSSSDDDDDEAEYPRTQVPVVRWAPLIHHLMEDLRLNHECEHTSWKGRRGPRRCEECNDTMPLFIYECRQCHIMACRRCRYNRL